MKKTRKTPIKELGSITFPQDESLKTRCARLRAEAEAGNDDSSAMFYTALYQAVSLRIPESVKEAALILVLNRKLAD